jgi:membrane protease subunit HflK
MNKKFGSRIDRDIKLPRLEFKWVIGVIVVIVGLYLIFSTFYSIGADEVGVITRFGKYVRTTKPGLHFKAPLGIEKLDKVRVKHIFKEEFGFRTIKAGVRSQYSTQSYEMESLQLTGDLNSAEVEWIVQYKIKDPVKYLFKVRNVTNTIRDTSESVMREVVGDHSVSEVLTVGRISIAQSVADMLQKILDDYNTGVDVVLVKLQGVDPPDPVKPAFNEVNEAKQEKERMINEAWESYNKVIPRAKGQAQQTIRKAEGYALNRVNRSKGDAEKFLAVWEEYRKAKDVTRRRLYLETMNEILPKVKKKYIVETDQSGLLKLLNLSEEVKKP